MIQRRGPFSFLRCLLCQVRRLSFALTAAGRLRNPVRGRNLSCKYARKVPKMGFVVIDAELKFEVPWEAREVGALVSELKSSPLAWKHSYASANPFSDRSPGAAEIEDARVSISLRVCRRVRAVQSTLLRTDRFTHQFGQIFDRDLVADPTLICVRRCNCTSEHAGPRQTSEYRNSRLRARPQHVTDGARLVLAS